jgi:putative ABC transport system permease protein
MLSDFRLALRHLIKSPGFTFVAVATLALCIGANSAIFSVVNAVLLRPFPYPQSEELAFVNNSYPKNDLLKAGVSIPDYLDRMERAPSIADGALYTFESYNLSLDQRPIRFLGIRATPSLFSTLGIDPLIGRTFTEEEAQIGRENVVVISHGLWTEQFGNRADVLGQNIHLDGQSHEIIGVMPAAFQFPQSNIKAWTPFAFRPEQTTVEERGHEFSTMIVRLQPGATPERLSAECATIIEQNLEQAPQFRPWVESSGFTGVATSILEETIADVRSMLWLLQAGVLAALLIGCANVANLLLTRALAREREIAIRAALGANRWNIVRQMLVESFLLFSLGGAFGFLVAMWGLTGIDQIGVGNLPRGESISLDRTVFLFTFACAGLTGLAFGLIPALQASRTNAGDALKSAGTRTTSGKRQRTLRNVLVVSEIALSLMLLATAGLLVRSFQKLSAQPTGFNAESVLTARFNLPEYAYGEDQSRFNFTDNLLRETNALPGVQSAAFTSIIPFGYTNSQGSYNIEGYEPTEGQSTPHGMIRSISPGFFETMRVPLLQGRAFTAQDHPDAERVVIIDRVLADRYWPGESPIGKRIYRGENSPENMLKIVGVVASVKQRGLDDPIVKETIFYPYQQRPTTSLTLTLRTDVEPFSLIYALRQTVLKIDSELPIFDIETLAGRIDATLERQRTPMVLLGIFSGMALLLAALGVYGVLAFNVSQRTQEIGIRMALGAGTRNVLTMIIRQGGWLVASGLLIGLVGFMAISRLLQHLVYEIAPIDPVSIFGAGLILCLVALFACAIPARRAAKVNPMVALRNE